MNTNTIIKLVCLSLLVCACKKELEPQESSDSATPPVAENTEAVANSATAITPQAVATPQAATAQPQNVQVQPQQPAKVAPGMNPPHGQPNHRCDIAVGAPLNSPQKMAAKPAMTINPSDIKTTQPPVISTKPVQAPPTNGGAPAILSPNAAPAAVTETAPGMNPPHGQPGHKCEVAVGAPLPK